MTAPESDNRARIKAAAFQLFREYGFRLTSYTKIAEASGLGRPLVQYYFPKKEDLATEFVVSILENASKLVNGSNGASPDPMAYVTQLGQVYYSFLLQDASMRRLTQELISNRQITSRVTAANADYTIPLFAHAQPNRELLRLSSIKATGGVYELLFIGLEAGQSFDPGNLSIQNTSCFAATALGASYHATMEDLAGTLLPADEIRSICDELVRRMFG